MSLRFHPHIPLSHPDLALIECVQGHYEGALSIEAIDTLLYRLYCDDLINPNYLFVSSCGVRDLTKEISESRERYQRKYPEASLLSLNITIYINPYTGKDMPVVMLPTLPEGTFLVGNLNIQQRMMPGGTTRLASTTTTSSPSVVNLPFLSRGGTIPLDNQ